MDKYVKCEFDPMKKIILITGCSSGLGKSLAKFLAERGHTVFAGIRNEEQRKKLAADWKPYQNLIPIALDITNDTQCHEVVEKIRNEKKKIDVLINNAGYTLAGPIETFTTKNFIKLLDTNMVGAFRLIREVIPSMKERKSGQIINVTSLNGLVALPNFSLYCSSKFALEGLTRSLVHELKKDNIKITNVEPGAMKGEVENEKKKKLPHTPAREKFWLVKFLLPIISIDDVAKRIVTIIESEQPPTSVLIGRDAIFTTMLQRILPDLLWNKLINKIWQG